MWYWRETREKLLLAGAVADAVLIVLINLELPVWPVLEGSWVADMLRSDVSIRLGNVILVTTLAYYVYYLFTDLIPAHSISSFRKYRASLEKDRDSARARRAMWPAFELIVRKVFDELNAEDESEAYGNLYIANGIHFDAQRDLDVNQRLNQVQISCGCKLLGLSKVEDVEKVLSRDGIDTKVIRASKSIITESGAVLWFSQSPTGGITAFMSPYKSPISSMNEKEIIVGFYSDPSQISERKVRVIFAQYFKYMSITSAIHQHTIWDYIWRLWLIFFDVRTKKLSLVSNRVFNAMVFGAALAGVFTYVFAASK